MWDAVVVGGGIAGLTAAYDLTRAGKRVCLVEQRPRLGGLIHTEHAGGLTIEAGPDALLMQKPAAGQLCAELNLPLAPTRAPRTAYVLREGRLIPLPSESVLGIPIAWRSIIAAGMLSPAGRARLARDLIQPSAAQPSPAQSSPAQASLTQEGEDDESVGAFVRRRFGDEAVRYIAQPLLGGIHVGDVERLSLRALFPALAEADRQPGSVLRTLAARRQPGDPDGVFRSIPNGLSDLVGALSRHLQQDDIRTGVSVTRIGPGAHRDRDRDGGEGVSYDVCLSSDEVLHARAIVLALPAFAIPELAAPHDAEVADLCRGITYASSASISLAYRRASVGHPLTGSGFVVPRGERETRLLAVSFVTSKWHGRAPDDVIVLRAFAGGVLDADLLDRDDQDLIDLTHDGLAPLLGLREQPFLTRVYRLWQASPQYETGHQARVAAIERRLTNHPGLFLTGSAFRGVGIPDNVADARRTAAEVVRWLDASSAVKMGD
jgi:protoporphyrinogen/coproporphyrinogen III oxidase